MFLFFRTYRRLDHVFSIVDFSAVFYILLLTAIILIIGATKYQKTNKKLFRHFLSCYFLKLLGCLAFVSVYTFYYGGGDTFRYFRNAKPLIDMATYQPIIYMQAVSKTRVIGGLESQFPEFSENFKYGQQFDMHRTANNYTVVRLASIFGVFGFGSYLTISLFFATLSSLGVWSLYRTFTKLFPGHENALSIPIIYFPSVWFWGSSLMKDSVVLCFLGFLTYSIYKIFIQKKQIPLYLILLGISIYVLTNVKEYVIIAYLPALLLWIILSLSNNFPLWLKNAFRPFLLLCAVGTIFIIGPKIGQISSKYALEEVLYTAERTGNYISRVNEVKGGSGYSLGEISYTPQGLLMLFPKAVTVTLYQPFLFQVNNPVMLLSGIESTLVLFFTIFVLFRVGIFRFIGLLFDKPFLLAALTFSVFFAFAIGISTFNFGSLARYKLPCLPFYGLAIIYPYSLYRKEKQEKRLKLLELENEIDG